MDTFYHSTASHNFTLDENDESCDNMSLKMNRSRQLLSEFGNDSTNVTLNLSQTRHSQSHYQQSFIQKQPKFSQSLLRRNLPATGVSQPVESPVPSMSHFLLFSIELSVTIFINIVY